MKLFFALLLTLSLALGFSACGTTPETLDPPADQADQTITWESAAEKPSEMLTNLTEDAILSLLQESYQNTAQFGDISFAADKIEANEGLIRMDFTVTAAYHPLIAGENPAEPLTLGEEQTLTLPMRATAEVTDEKIIPESLALETRDTQNGTENYLSPTYYLPQFGDNGIYTMHGRIVELTEDDGRPYVVVEQMLWVTETHGYTDNGYFLLDLAHRHTLPLDAACEVHYYADPSTAAYLPLEDYLAAGYDFADKLYEINAEDAFVRHIVELYQP